MDLVPAIGETTTVIPPVIFITLSIRFDSITNCFLAAFWIGGVPIIVSLFQKL
jgi:hypothetical protein